MKLLQKTKKRGRIFDNSIAFICVLVSLCCLLVVIMTTLNLPQVSSRRSFVRSYKTTNIPENEELGKFGKMMLDMLPNDLAFTVFVPSEEAFARDLRLRANESLAVEKMNDTYAILSRILGFSAVARSIYSNTVHSDMEIDYDSLSGYRLYISKDNDEMLMVNRVQSRRVDLKRGEIVVHIMDGVIMDAEFEQAVQPDYNEED